MLDLQRRLKFSLERAWRNSLSNDWVPKERARTFPLRHFYVRLRWVNVVQRAIQNFRKELTEINDILEIMDPGHKPEATKILVIG